MGGWLADGRYVIGRRSCEGLTVRIEFVVASAPAQFRVERGHKVEENPGDYDHVINGDICYYQQRTVAQTWRRESRGGDGKARQEENTVSGNLLSN